MPSFELKCKIVNIGAVTKVTESFNKREIIVEVDYTEQYPQTIKIEATQLKCDDPFILEARKGDEATIHINLRGNVYDNKAKGKKEVFNSLQFWKGQLNRTTAAAPQQQAAPQQTSYSSPAPIDYNAPGQDDDLPF